MRRTELTVRQREEERERRPSSFIYRSLGCCRNLTCRAQVPASLSTQRERTQRVRGRTPKEEEQTKQKGLVLWVTLLRGNDIVVGKVILPLLCSQKSIFSKGTGA